MAFRNTDPLLKSLSRARPDIDDAQVMSNSAQAQALLVMVKSGESTEVTTRPPRRRIGWRVALPTAAVVAAALTVALVAGNSIPPTDIALVAASSQKAFSTTGRATVEFATDIGLDYEQKGRIQLTFAGENVESATEFGPSEDSQGFKTQNRTVAGNFYLLDGPPGQQRWVHITNEPGLDLYNLDPRRLLELLAPSAEFETVGDENGLRRLRATSLDDVPDMNLGLGPLRLRPERRDGKLGEAFTRLDLWVGPDNVVRRLDLATESTETHRSGGKTLLVPRADGQMHKMVDPNTGELVTTTHRSTYSVTFSDLGADIEITVPDGATQVEGKG